MTGSATLAARDIVRPGHTHGDAGLRRPRYGWWLLAALLVAAAAVGSQLFAGAVSSGGARTAAGIDSASPASAAAADHLLPAAVAGVVSRSIGRDEPAYAVRPVVGGFATDSVAQHLTARFSAAGARVSSGATHLSVSLAGYGRAGSLRPVAPVAPAAGSNEVTYRHAGLSEWYANGPLGVEQGFVLRSSPGSRTSEPVQLTLAVGGNGRATLAHGAVTFHGPRAGAISYGDLVATDATGRRLPAHLMLRGGDVLISVDDRDARYPIRIDPLFQTATVTDPGGINVGANEHFAQSAAIDGDTLVVGAPNAGLRHGAPVDPGAIYVFVEPSSGWADATETAKLTDPSQPDGQIGSIIALSGNTIVTTYGESTGSEVFVKPAGGWSNSTPVAAHLSITPGGYVADLATNGSTIVEGDASGADQVAVFSEPAGGWTDGKQTAILKTSDSSAGLGFSVGISGDTIVAATRSGSAYVYVEPAGGWASATQTAELTASDGGQSGVGESVAVSGDTIAVGDDEEPASPHSGAIYEYTEPPGGWTDATQTAELTSPSGGGDSLGYSVGVSGSTIVGTALGGPGGTFTGAVEVFTEPAGGWTDSTDAQVLVPNDPNAYGINGGAIDSNGDVIAKTNISADATGHADDSVYVWSPPQPPAITSVDSTTDTIRTPLDFHVATSGVPAPSITETGPLPSGVTFTDNGDGTADLAGTPAVGTAGNYPITITASNGQEPDATQSFTLTISTAKTPPEFISADSDTVTYGSPFSVTVTTSGYPAPKITKSGSAPGVTFTDNGDGTATISGTPSGSASGPYTFNLTAKSPGQMAATQTFTLTVNRAPTLATIKNVTVIVGNPLNAAVAAPKGYPEPTVYTPTQLPAGIQFTVNPDNSSTFSGTPSPGTGGTYPITITASNGSGPDANQSFVLTVEEPPAFTSSNSYSAAVGSTFTFPVTATGSPTPKITESGPTPAGVKWNASSGTLSGTPKKGTAGSYQLTFTATNKAAATTQLFTLTVS